VDASVGQSLQIVDTSIPVDPALVSDEILDMCTEEQLTWAVPKPNGEYD